MSGAHEPVALSPREADAFLTISKRGLSRLIGAGKIEAAGLARASTLRPGCRVKPTICRSSLIVERMRYSAKPNPLLMI